MFDNITRMKALARIAVFVLLLFSPVASMAESSCHTVGDGPFGPVVGGFVMGILALGATLIAFAVVGIIFPPSFVPMLMLIAACSAVITGFYTGYRAYKKMGGSLSRIVEHNEERSEKLKQCEINNQKANFHQQSSEKAVVFEPTAAKQVQPEMQMQNDQNRQKLLKQYYDAAAKGDSALMQKLSLELKAQQN